MKKVIFTLFFALFLCGSSYSKTNNTIESELQNILNQKSNELIDINIIFKSQVNSAKLMAKTERNSDITVRREYAVLELKKFSEQTQNDVLSILQAEENNGNVVDINRLWIVNSISCKASRDVIYRLASHPDVAALVYNKEIQLISKEEMAVMEAQQSRALPVAHIVSVNADHVWEQGYTGKNVIVAVLDSGTNYKHNDIKDHLWEGKKDINDDGVDEIINGWNFVNNSSDITDDFGHGTHCAGIVCGDGTSGQITGVAYDAKLMTVKIVGRAGSGTVTQMLSGVQFAIENKAQILSMSLGFKNYQITTEQKNLIRNAFDNVLAANVIVCAAAGNDGNNYGAPDNIDYPAACPSPWRNPDQTLEGGLSSVLCVGAYDLGMSSRGPATWEGTDYNDYPYNNGASMGLIRPDISAPGNLVYSLNSSLVDKYNQKSGTSQATPCVAGVIALMLEKNSSLTPANITKIIEETASYKPASKNNSIGAGHIDALAAINAVNEGTKQPFIVLKSFTPSEVAPGDRTINITLKNEGRGSCAQTTNGTLSVDSPFVTIDNTTNTIGQISTGNTKSFNFDINIDEQTPNGHIANFTYVITSNTYTWKYNFSITISRVPNIVFNAVNPGSINVNQDVNIKVSMKNIGTADMPNNTKLTLSTLNSNSSLINIINNEATINGLGVGETAEGTFTIRASDNIQHGRAIEFFIEVEAESTTTTNYTYEFETNNEGWTCFDAANNNIDEAWWHSSNNIAHNKASINSHSGSGHLMSESILTTNGHMSFNNPIDNYLVSPNKIKVTKDSKISFYACANIDAYYEEHFGLAISSTDNNSANCFTTIQEWTIGADQRTEWRQYVVDLSAYQGQEVYVAIRHFFTEEQWEDVDNGFKVDALNIDNIILHNVAMNLHHIPTYSDDDPNYFEIIINNMVELPMPSNFSATANGVSEIDLMWNAVPKAQSYNVYCDGKKIANVKENSYTHSNLTHNTNYCYKVTAVYAGQEFDPSSEVCATTKQKDYSIAVKDNEPKTSKTIYVGVNESDLRLTIANDGMYKLPSRGNIVLSCDNPYVTLRSITPGTPILPDDVKPSAPVVKAIATGDTSIELTWNNVLGATSYNIYHGTSTYNTTNNYYTINGLTPSTNYCFNVTAVNSVGESAASEACATTHAKVVTKPSAPTNLTVVATATATGENAFILSWNEVSEATSYKVYGFSNGTSPIASGLTETTYTVTGSGTNALVNGNEYCYYVTSVNSAGESNASDIVCATAGAIQYRIRRASTTDQYLTAINASQNESGTYGGVAVANLNATSKNQIFTLEDAGNDRFYLLSANNKYIKCWDWNVDAYSETDKTALKKVEVATGDGYYIQNCDNGKYFKVEWNEDGNKNFVYGDCDGSNCTKEIWVFEPVAPTASKSAKRSTTAGDPISAEITALDANVEVTSDLVVEIDPSIPNNTEIILSININNNNATSDIQKYNMDLSVKMIVKNDIGTPKGVTITDVKDKSLTVKWNAVANAKYYNVYRDGSFLITTPSTSIFESDLDPETTYCYTVTGVNNDGESEPSMEVCATTLEEIGEVKVVSFEIGSAIGSNVSLKTRLINDSKSTTPANTIATLTCSNPNVTIVNGTATVGALASKATKDVTFTVKIADNVPYNYTLDFDVDVEYESGGTGGTETRTYTFDSDLNGFTTLTEDDHNWYHSSNQSAHGYNKSYNGTTPSGGGFIFSESFCNSGQKSFNPDHWIIIPEQIVPSNLTTIEFYACSMANQTTNAAETFGVFVSTTNKTDVNAFTEVGKWTLDKKSYSLKMALKSTMLIDYEDQKIWVAIRHYGDGDNAALAVDDVTISNIKVSSLVTNTSSFFVTVNPSINAFSGSGAWNVASNWSKGSVPTTQEDVIINGNATIESGNVTAKSITINSGSLTVNSGATLTVSGSFLNKNTKAFIIMDGAQVFQNNNNVSATFNMSVDNPSSWGYDHKGGWQFISSPMLDAAIASFKPTSETDYDLFKYDGTQELEWINVKNHGTDFESEFQLGRGYIASYEAETTSSFEGTLNSGTSFTFKDVKSFNAEDHYGNFYLLGNPFTFNMDWKNISANGVYNGYATISYSDGSYDYHTDGTINVGDGFMVNVTDATPVLSYAHYTRARNEKHESINVMASNIYGSDNVIISLAGQEEEGFTKLENINKDIAEIYVENKGGKYGIFSFDEDINEVPVSFKAAKTGDYIIRIKPEGKFEYITLVDNFTGVETDMIMNDYSFKVLSTEGNRNRFTVKFGKEVKDVTENFVYQSGDELIINAEGSVQIIDVMGRIVYSNEINGDSRINISKLNKAAYIIRLINGNEAKTQKIVVY